MFVLVCACAWVCACVYVCVCVCSFITAVNIAYSGGSVNLIIVYINRSKVHIQGKLL